MTNLKMDDLDYQEVKVNVERTNNLRSDSGNIEYSDTLTTFFYLLLRDELPAGKIERIVQEVISGEETVLFTNGFLARYADNLAITLKNAKVNALTNNLEKVFEQTEVERLSRLREEDRESSEAHFGDDEDQLVDLQEKVEKAIESASDEELKEAEDKIQEATMEVAEDLDEDEEVESEFTEEEVSRLEVMKATVEAKTLEEKIDISRDYSTKKQESDVVKRISETLKSIEAAKDLVPTNTVKQVADILRDQMMRELSSDVKDKLLKNNLDEDEVREIVEEQVEEALLSEEKQEDQMSRGTLRDVNEGRAFPEALGQVFEPESEPVLDGTTEMDVPGENFSVIVRGDRVTGVRKDGVFRRVK